MLTPEEIYYLERKYLHLRTVIDVSTISKEELLELRDEWLKEYREFHNIQQETE